MNRILKDIIKRKSGHYCHALEVETLYDLKSCIEQLVSEFVQTGYKTGEIVEFFESISIYALEEKEEKEIYNFNIPEYIKELI